MLLNLYQSFKPPARIRIIGAIIKIARWLARPQIGKHKFGEHYDIIISGKISSLEECLGLGKLDHGILMVNGFEIAEYQDEEHKKIADAINQITGESE